MNDDTNHIDEKELETTEQVSEPVSIDYKEKYIRLLAEFTNYQKLKEDEVRAMAVYGNKSLLLKMIDLLDDIEVGLQQDHLGEETKDLLQMLKEKFDNTLKIEGVTEVSIKQGADYDPQKCEVITTIDDPENKGKIVQVVRKGYMISDRVLRSAKVVVGK
jgi:molecular chaperone GrpE